jgi:hypothetical protein
VVIVLVATEVSLGDFPSLYAAAFFGRTLISNKSKISSSFSPNDDGGPLCSINSLNN